MLAPQSAETPEMNETAINLIGPTLTLLSPEFCDSSDARPRKALNWRYCGNLKSGVDITARLHDDVKWGMFHHAIYRQRRCITSYHRRCWAATQNSTYYRAGQPMIAGALFAMAGFVRITDAFHELSSPVAV